MVETGGKFEWQVRVASFGQCWSSAFRRSLPEYAKGPEVGSLKRGVWGLGLGLRLRLRVGLGLRLRVGRKLHAGRPNACRRLKPPFPAISDSFNLTRSGGFNRRRLAPDASASKPTPLLRARLPIAVTSNVSSGVGGARVARKQFDPALTGEATYYRNLERKFGGAGLNAPANTSTPLLRARLPIA